MEMLGIETDAAIRTLEDSAAKPSRRKIEAGHDLQDLDGVAHSIRLNVLR
jgi:hypothetical protein